MILTAEIQKRQSTSGSDSSDQRSGSCTTRTTQHVQTRSSLTIRYSSTLSAGKTIQSGSVSYQSTAAARSELSSSDHSMISRNKAEQERNKRQQFQISRRSVQNRSFATVRTMTNGRMIARDQQDQEQPIARQTKSKSEAEKQTQHFKNARSRRDRSSVQSGSITEDPFWIMKLSADAGTQQERQPIARRS